MGILDMEERRLLEHEDVFADIVNVLLFGGAARVREGELRSSAARTAYRTGGVLRGQERDIAKHWEAGGVRLALLCLENQTQPYGPMPVRIVGYDGAEYRGQIRRREDGERLGAGGGGRFYPVVTLVLYYGGRRWAEPRNLLGLLAVPEELAPYVSDYRIHVFEIAFLPDETIRKFRSDFRTVAELFRQNRLLKERRISRISLTPRRIEHAEETLGLLRAVTGDDRFEEVFHEMERKGEEKMFEAFDIMRENGLVEGRAAGRVEGRDEARAMDLRVLVRTLKKFVRGEGAVFREIRQSEEYSDISEEEIRRLYEEQ